MIIDANHLRTDPEETPDVCIIGAGPAGISLALELAKQKLSVTLLESGGTDYEKEVQDMAVGKSTGHPYYPLHTSRMRYLGGTSNHWSGHIVPLEEEDFQEKSWIPGSGWPITKKDLVPYYRRADDYLQLGTVSKYKNIFQKNGQMHSHPVVSFVEEESPLLDARLTHFHPLRFGSVYRKDLEQSKSIRLYLHATFTRFFMNDHSGRVDAVEIINSHKQSHRIKARTYVMAAGGMENSRLLLLTRNQFRNILGEGHNLVGRHFMEHIGGGLGWMLVPRNLKGIDDFALSRKQAMPVGKEIHYRNAIQKQYRILNTSLEVEFPDQQLIPNAWYPDINKFQKQIPLLDRNPGPYDIYGLSWKLEQIPMGKSSITLLDEKDALGQNRINFHWHMDDMEIASMNQDALLLASELGSRRMGRVIVGKAPGFEHGWIHIIGHYHHMGGNRMSRSSNDGVVDENLKMHGMKNLYITGSSVFPTGGYSNPTYTILALTLRLADHLKRIL